MCICLAGFTGEHCEIAVSTSVPTTFLGTTVEPTVPSNPCDSSPCFNGGTCTSTDSTTFTCDCSTAPNFIGDLCDVGDTCSISNPCQNGALCQNLDTFQVFEASVAGQIVQVKTSDYECICPTGFQGPTCNDIITTIAATTFDNSACDDVNCPNGQVCVVNSETNLPECGIIHPVNRLMNKNAANEILPYFLTTQRLNRQQLNVLSNHGCWCAKILNPNSEQAFGGPTTVDELDGICKQWASACNCIHSVGGSCHSFNDNDYTNIFIVTGNSGLATNTECEIGVNDDECLVDSCKVHDYFAQKIADYINSQGYSVNEVEENFCRTEKVKNGGLESELSGTIMMCSGDVPDNLYMTELECNCQNGQGSIGNACPGIDVEFCVSCDSGFYLQNNLCVPNQCTCSNGVGFTGTDCSENGASGCSSCNSGYSLNLFNVCILNVCSCENGEGAIGESCPVSNSLVCASCDDGFVLENENCVLEGCNCANGTPVEFNSCNVPGTEQCESCENGFYLNENSICVQYQVAVLNPTEECRSYETILGVAGVYESIDSSALGGPNAKSMLGSDQA